MSMLQCYYMSTKSEIPLLKSWKPSWSEWEFMQLCNSLSSRLFLHSLLICRTHWRIIVSYWTTLLCRFVRRWKKPPQKSFNESETFFFLTLLHTFSFIFLQSVTLSPFRSETYCWSETAGSAAQTACTSYAGPLGWPKLPWVFSTMRWVRQSGNPVFVSFYNFIQVRNPPASFLVRENLYNMFFSLLTQIFLWRRIRFLEHECTCHIICSLQYCVL